VSRPRALAAGVRRRLAHAVDAVRPLRALAAVLAAALLGGCGSAPVDALPPPARPGAAPPLAAPPAGRVVPLAAAPTGVLADPLSGLVAVTLAGRPALVLDGATGAPRPRAPRPEPLRLLALAGPDADPRTVATARGRVLVADRAAATLTVHDATTGRRLARVRVAREPGAVGTLARGRQVAVLSLRERVVERYDAATLRRLGRVPAGVGPTDLATDGKDRLYVTDTHGDALLVYHRLPRFEPTRRYSLLGGPSAVAADRVRNRLWVTLARRNELAELNGGARPGLLRRVPAVRRPTAVAVDSATGLVVVAGSRPGALQLYRARSRTR